MPDLPTQLLPTRLSNEHAVYVLRVWFERDGEQAVWRASVKAPQELARRHFSQLETLLSYLTDQLEPHHWGAG